MKLTVVLSACLSMLAATPAIADPWLGPGDTSLRHDLNLLSDAGIVSAPLSTWPVSWPEISRDVSRSPSAASCPCTLLPRSRACEARPAKRRARAACDSRPPLPDRKSQWRCAASPTCRARRAKSRSVSNTWASALRIACRRPASWTRTTARKSAPTAAMPRSCSATGWCMRATSIAGGGRAGREASSMAAMRGRFRPSPSSAIIRIRCDTPGCEWIGQFRFVATMGQLEEEREDAPNAQLFGMRATWKPHSRIEIGISRTAQWCGDGRPCDLDTFWDLLIGNDNDQSLEEQPGNQLAGFDMRWSLPWAPVAIYAQAIGEDEANFMPSKYLGLGRHRVLGRVRRAVLACARRGGRHRVQLLREPAGLRLRVPQRHLQRRLPVSRSLDRPLDRRRQPPAGSRRHAGERGMAAAGS